MISAEISTEVSSTSTEYNDDLITTTVVTSTKTIDLSTRTFQFRFCFAYVAIIAILSAVSFIIVLDILKYGFGIDPVREEPDQIRRKRALLKRTNPETRKPQNTFHLRRMNKVSPFSQRQ
ncbi:unnamed protein product [Rotaria sordida]|uniref:Uncharacterized protein n=1 Tax=Rotaria sordida TaxID=392033 RepID=A0A815FIG7_9BILA|nr:unnamed protein product [Rotaria sordida]CAF1584795.1 unnamed protein product [Rotaria sordida]